MFDRYKKSFPAKLSLYVISFITILSFVLVGVFYHLLNGNVVARGRG